MSAIKEIEKKKEEKDINKRIKKKEKKRFVTIVLE